MCGPQDPGPHTWARVWFPTARDSRQPHPTDLNPDRVSPSTHNRFPPELNRLQELKPHVLVVAPQTALQMLHSKPCTSILIYTPSMQGSIRHPELSTPSNSAERAFPKNSCIVLALPSSSCALRVCDASARHVHARVRAHKRRRTTSLSNISFEIPLMERQSFRLRCSMTLSITSCVSTLPSVAAISMSRMRCVTGMPVPVPEFGTHCLPHPSSSAQITLTFFTAAGRRLVETVYQTPLTFLSSGRPSALDCRRPDPSTHPVRAHPNTPP